MADGLERIVVAVCTYGRPEPLRAFLDAYAADPTTADATLLVVDNNPDGSARATVDSAPLARIVYDHEPRPGIAAARNRCLEHLTEDVDAIVFVDDDEEPVPGWLGALVDCARRYGADIVNGQVETTFPDDAPGWVRARGLFAYPPVTTGSSAGLPATNTTLMRRTAWVAAGSPRFDERFSGSGGSDTEFFWHLIHEFGATFVWCAEAVVREPLVESRMSLTWAWRRHLRGGNVLGRIKLRSQSRARVALGGVGRMGKGVLGGVAEAARGRNPAGWFVGRVARGVGMTGSAMRHVVVEYARGGAGEG